jgi:hypothetical protein
MSRLRELKVAGTLRAPTAPPPKEPTERLRCAFNGKFVTPCDGLVELLELTGPKSRRIELVTLRNRRTHQASRNMVVIYSGKYRGPGIVSNFCPMCGIQIFKEDDE